MLNQHWTIPSVADAERVERVAESLVWILGADPRVQAVYAEWRVDFLALLLAQFPSKDRKPKFSATADRYLDSLKGTLLDMGVAYAWLPKLLFADFVVTIQNELSDEKQRLVLQHGALDDDVPPGRRAKDEGRHILRDVEWYYRSEIKTPRVCERKRRQILRGPRDPRAATWCHCSRR
jgi:hypothetical protein